MTRRGEYVAVTFAILGILGLIGLVEAVLAPLGG